MLPPLTTNAWLRFDAIRRGVLIAHPNTALEIGTGGGAFATWVSGRVDYLGVEQDDSSRALATHRLEHARSARVVADLADVGDARFDLVCAFEVLEHIDDDAGALKQWCEYLNPGGHVLLSVPAHSDQFGPHDEAAGHFRRYDKPQLLDVLHNAGLTEVRLTSHGAGLGQALEFARNKLAGRHELAPTFEQRTAASGRMLQPSSTMSFLACAALAAPFRLVQAPFAQRDVGTGYVVLARSS